MPNDRAEARIHAAATALVQLSGKPWTLLHVQGTDTVTRIIATDSRMQNTSAEQIHVPLIKQNIISCKSGAHGCN
jgi:hypothetical protein